MSFFAKSGKTESIFFCQALICGRGEKVSSICKSPLPELRFGEGDFLWKTNNSTLR